MSTIRQRKTTEHEASVIVGTEKKKSQSQNKDLPVLFVGLLCFRVLNSLAISTFFNPDEFWQSLEVAHNLSFGYGYLTWEWKEGLRSYLHPLIYSFVYAVITTLGLDSPTNIVKTNHSLITNNRTDSISKNIEWNICSSRRFLLLFVCTQGIQ